MDMEKIKVRQDLSRMVLNYYIRGKITEDQSARICNYIDSTIGGGILSKRTDPKKAGQLFPFLLHTPGKKSLFLAITKEQNKQQN